MKSYCTNETREVHQNRIAQEGGKIDLTWDLTSWVWDALTRLAPQNRSDGRCCWLGRRQ